MSNPFYDLRQNLSSDAQQCVAKKTAEMKTRIRGHVVENWSEKQQPHHKTMHGDYCILEPLNINQHGKPLFQSFQTDELGEDWTYLPSGPFNSYAEFENWLAQGEKHNLIFAIKDKTANTPQGIASYHDISPIHGVIEVGAIVFSRHLQKTRAATEAMYLMMKHVFDDLGYRRYQWRCNALNAASRLAAERLGFQFEGIFRHASVFKGRDSEWPRLKGKLQRWLNASNFDNTGKQIIRLQDI